VFDLDGYLTYCCLADRTDDQSRYAIDPLVVDSTRAVASETNETELTPR
jgi:hypothetical protein